MSLPTCPSCGQSVLEDDAVDCPFCGAAMDGSRERQKHAPAQKEPRAQSPRSPPHSPKNPLLQPHKAPPPHPAKPTPAHPPQLPQNPELRLATAAKWSSTKTTPSASEPPADHKSSKPHSNPKKDDSRKPSVPCANRPTSSPNPPSAKAFAALIPNAWSLSSPLLTPPNKKTNVAPHDSLTKPKPSAAAAEEALPRRRSPILLYAIGGAVLAGITALVLTQLNRKPDTTQFSAALDLSELQRLAEEDAAKEAAKQAAAKAAEQKAAENPAQDIEDNIRRMIALARSEMRDKALARRMTGDLWLRLGRSEEAAVEFNQLLVVDKSRGFYRVLPQLAKYWRSRAAGDSAAAAEALKLAETEARQRTFPRTGRAATDAALALATVLAAEGRMPDATALVASRQLDRSIPANLDQSSGTAWLFIATQCRDAAVAPAGPRLPPLGRPTPHRRQPPHSLPDHSGSQPSTGHSSPAIHAPPQMRSPPLPTAHSPSDLRLPLWQLP
ncbi:MAG UNVERIFIED_CONTAM: hypothetical protein LVR18_00550 [Planctomycetaceae bacterium]